MTKTPPAVDPKVVEAVAVAIKDEIGRQFEAKPLVDAQPGDWAATGGTLDLSRLARVAVDAVHLAEMMPVKPGAAGD